MGEFTHQVVGLARGLVARKATSQAGVLSGDNPSTYNMSDPLRLWIIQIIIITAMIQFLSLIFGRIRQPRVISEIIGGVFLGPTVMGRIPGFQAAIFPAAGLPSIALTSNIGLVLYLFIIGLEIDTRLVKRKLRAATLISFAGLVVPLGLGAALGVGIYRKFTDPSVNFGYFVLFSAVAIGITAFPVLCRILTALKLLDTTVGVVTLSAGVGNDIVGWILLALTVALVNASSGLTALWVLLSCVGFVIFLLFPVKWAYVWLARRTGSLEQGSPTATMMAITLLIVFISAFFTDIIGVQAIFGGFLAGLIIPHENGYAISIVEKLEDLVSIILLPLYFVQSGLSTNLGLLNDGVTWGYTILICVVGFSSKFFACLATAKATGFNWHESGAIGALMSCKGLVELIVLNVGLQAGVLDTRTFSMFVVQAIVVTFITTPLTLLFYPEKHRVHEGIIKDKPIGGQGGEDGTGRKIASGDDVKTKFAIILDKMEQLPAAMTLTQLLQPPSTASTLSLVSSVDEKALEAGAIPALSHRSTGLAATHPRITIDALRLIELTSRTSALLKSQEADSLLLNDPVVSVFRTFGHLNHLVVSAALSVVTHDEFPAAIANHVAESESQMIILPWCRGVTSHDATEEGRGHSSSVHNPFDGIFHKTTSLDQTTSVVYSEFIRKVFLNSTTDVALFVDRGMSIQSAGPTTHHLFLPFFGGPDDRLALSFLVQLCKNTSVSATVIRVERTDALSPSSTITDAKATLTTITNNTIAGADTIYGHQTTQTRLASDTADTIIWDRYSRSSDLPRITFDTRISTQPLHTLVELVNGEISKLTSSQRLVIVAGRSKRMAVESHQAELTQLIAERGSPIGSVVRKTLGDVGAALVAAATQSSLLIMQATLSVASE